MPTVIDGSSRALLMMHFVWSWAHYMPTVMDGSSGALLMMYFVWSWAHYMPAVMDGSSGALLMMHFVWSWAQYMPTVMDGISGALLMMYVVSMVTQMLQHVWWCERSISTERLGVQNTGEYSPVSSWRICHEAGGAEERRMPSLRISGSQPGDHISSVLFCSLSLIFSFIMCVSLLD